MIARTSPAGVLLVRAVGGFGRGFLRFVAQSGQLVIFVGATAARLADRPRLRELVVQVAMIGAGSIGVIALAATFTGLVLALQGYNALVRFGSENMVGSLVALSLLRELSPVLTGLMVTARAGSAMTATIGNMAISEQIDALKSLAVDPLSYLVLPRLLAAALTLPILTALFSLTGIAAAFVSGVGVLGLDGLAFMSNVRTSVELSDVSIGLWKSLVFGVLIASVATFRGYQTTGGAAGVGRATSRTVVETAVLILCGDYVMTALLL